MKSDIWLTGEKLLQVEDGLTDLNESESRRRDHEAKRKERREDKTRCLLCWSSIFHF